MNDHAMADALDHFLDELVTGSRVNHPGVEAELARTANRFLEFGQSPAPSVIRERVWKQLSTATPLSGGASVQESTYDRSVAPESISIVERRPSPHPRHDRRFSSWTSNVARSAALLMLLFTIAAGILIQRQETHNHVNSIPAGVVLSPSPTAVKIETVVSMHIPAGSFSLGDLVSSGFSVFSIPAGNRSTWQPKCCPGPLIEYVVEGSYSVRAEAPIRVTRADGSIEEIPADSEVTLTSGDSLLSRNETGVETWNSGTVETVLLSWTYTEYKAAHVLPGWGTGQTDIRRDPIRLESGLVTIVRIALPEGGDALLDYPDGLVVEAVEQDGDIIRRTDGSINRIEASPGLPFVAYIAWVEASASPEATPTEMTTPASDS